jgi:hypothetical protein
MDNYKILSGIVRSCNIDNTFSVELDDDDAVFGTVLSVSLDNIRLVDSSRLCLNDNLVEFGIIENLTQSFADSDNYSDFHVCQTKVFTKLCDEKKNTGCYRKMYKSVHRWFRNVDLFKKKFILFPIHEHHHWFLICYVNLGQFLLEVQRDPNNTKNGKKMEDSFVFVMDSIHRKNGIKYYKRHFEIINHFLSLLFVATYTNSVDYAMGEIGIGWLDDFYKGLSTRMDTFVLKTPKQPNGYDCGMYLIKNCRNLFQIMPSMTVTDLRVIITSRELNFRFNYSHFTIHLERENLFITIRDKLLLLKADEIQLSLPNSPSMNEDIRRSTEDKESTVPENNYLQCIEEKLSNCIGSSLQVKRTFSTSLEASTVFEPLTFDYASDEDHVSLRVLMESEEVLPKKKIKEYTGLGSLNWNDDFF